MPYYLQTTSTEGSNLAYIQMDQMTQGIGGGSTRISWDIICKARRDGTDFIPFGRESSSDRIFFLKSDNSIELRVGNQTFNVTSGTHGVDLDLFHKYELRHREINTTYETSLYIDDVFVVTWTIDGQDQWLLPDRLFTLGTSTRYGAIEYYSYTDNITATNSRYYDANASNGTGTVLPETTGNGADGTQVNTWPADDSEWGGTGSGVPGVTSKTLERAGVAVSATTARVFIWAGHSVDIDATAAAYKNTAQALSSGVMSDIDLSSTSIAVNDNITIVALPATGGPGIILETTAEEVI